jgi:hypothetical protein
MPNEAISRKTKYVFRAVAVLWFSLYNSIFPVCTLTDLRSPLEMYSFPCPHYEGIAVNRMLGPLFLNLGAR